MDILEFGSRWSLATQTEIYCGFGLVSIVFKLFVESASFLGLVIHGAALLKSLMSHERLEIILLIEFGTCLTIYGE